MKRNAIIGPTGAAAALTLLLLGCVAAAAQTELMPVDSIEPGMTGVVRTTFHGTEVEEVEAEVLGVMRSALGPNIDLVLIRLRGERMQFQGVANGMSGSPFYIDGKLVGALSIRIGLFAKEPIAGVTPIADIVDTQFGGRGRPHLSLDYHRLWSGNESIRQLARRLGRELPRGSSPPQPDAAGVGLRPFTLGIYCSGLEATVAARYAPLFRELGAELTAFGSGVGGPVDGPLEPGVPVSVDLVRGDLRIGASGTLTHIEGDRVWAFGHPFFRLGPVEWPLARAEIIEVFPSMQGSFNISAAGQQVGTIVQDRATAVYGVLGREPSMLPLRIEVRHAGEAVSVFSYELVRNALLTPALIDIAVSNSLLATQRQFGESSVAISGTLVIDGYEDVNIDDFYSGFNLGTRVGALPAAVYFFLSDNEFSSVTVTDIRLTLDLVEEQRVATLQRAWITDTELEPGESFQVLIELRPRRDKELVLEQDYMIPPTLQSGAYRVTVGSGSEITRLENEMVRGELRIRDLRHMIRLINSLRPNNRLYAQVWREEEGIYFDGDLFPGLPPSALSVMRVNSGDDRIIRLLGTVVDERRMETEYFVSGVRNLRFTVRRR